MGHFSLFFFGIFYNYLFQNWNKFLDKTNILDLWRLWDQSQNSLETNIWRTRCWKAVPFISFQVNWEPSIWIGRCSKLSNSWQVSNLCSLESLLLLGSMPISQKLAVCNANGSKFTLMTITLNSLMNEQTRISKGVWREDFFFSYTTWKKWEYVWLTFFSFVSWKIESVLDFFFPKKLLSEHACLQVSLC